MNLKLMRRDIQIATALDARLIEALSKACTECEHIWRTAKAEADFALVQPQFQTVLNLTREAAGIYGEVLALSPYDALLEMFAPTQRWDEIEPLFEDYARFLPDFLDAVQTRQSAMGPPVKPRPVPIETQRKLIDRLSEAVGFHPDAGRIDTSAHPFSTGYPGDQRITVSYTSEEPMFAVMAVLHECGHAAYEAGLPKQWNRHPVGQSLGMVIHESQSLSIEMQASRSTEFLTWLAGQASDIFGPDPAYDPENFICLQQWVQPGFIRVDADEVTYPAHVILRTRLERALLADDLAVADLPGAWNTGMKELLGLDVPNDRLGCLQDIHWYDGAFGYFPTYSLGAMFAAQLAEAARKSDSTILNGLSEGRFKPLIDWLGRHIHSKGSSLTANELILTSSGSPLTTDAFKRHLHLRYL